MLEGKLDRFEETSRGATYVVESGDAATMAAELERFFASEGYRLEEGTPQSGIYGRGSGAAYAFFSALSSRMKFKVEVLQEGGKVRLVVGKGMSGMWGGLLGRSKMKNEVSRVILKIKSMFS
jgi:hypothetical protein